MQTTDKFQKGLIYQFNGVEMVPLEPSQESKVPVTEAALEAVKKVRSMVGKRLGMRPELSVVTSALLLLAQDDDLIVAKVKEIGAAMYR